jgi:A/G-specific adenine glycosylase
MRSWPGWTQVYTHRREAVSPLHLNLDRRFSPAEGLRWMPCAELGALPLGKRDQRLRDLLPTPGQCPLEAPEPAELIKALTRNRKTE